MVTLLAVCFWLGAADPAHAIFMEIRPNFDMHITGSNGSSSLDLGRISENKVLAFKTLHIKIDGNPGSAFRISQQLTDPLMSHDGTLLNEDALSFNVSAEGDGQILSGATSQKLSDSFADIYRSAGNGTREVLVIQFQFHADAAQKAGIYSGNLQFKIDSETADFPSKFITVPVRVEIGPIFYLDMEFSGDTESTLRKIVLSAHSNLGRPYQVSQFFDRKLTPMEGTAMRADDFLYYVDAPLKGHVKTTHPAAVPEGESVLFTSDDKGTPEKFVVYYSLKIPADAKASAYNSVVRYSIVGL